MRPRTVANARDLLRRATRFLAQVLDEGGDVSAVDVALGRLQAARLEYEAALRRDRVVLRQQRLAVVRAERLRRAGRPVDDPDLARRDTEASHAISHPGDG